MVVGVVAAARMAGVSRATVSRYCRNGKLSFSLDASGDRQIDTAELTRVFGGLQPPATLQSPLQSPSQSPPATVAATTPDTTLVAELRRQVDRLEGELARVRVELGEEQRERRQLADRLWELQQKFTRLLPAPDAAGTGPGYPGANGNGWPPRNTVVNAVRQSFWRFVANNSA